MKEKLQKLEPRLREAALITLGTLLISFGTYFFRMPNNFTIGGVTGIAIVVSRFLPGVSTGTLVMIFNVALLAVGFAFLSRKFGLSTVYSSLLLSGTIWVLERVWPMEAPFTDEPFLELVFSVGIPALGSAILFNIGASSGGTDIIAMLLKKYTPIDNIGAALMVADFAVAVSACFIFGVKTGLFSILGLFMKSFFVDSVIESINQCKYMHIICSDPEPVCDFIAKKLHRGATICEVTGAYTHHRLFLVLSVVRRGQAVYLRRYVRSIEPHAFIMITNTSEIIGKGFHSDN